VNHKTLGLAAEVLACIQMLLIHYAKQELEHSFKEAYAFKDCFYSASF